MRFESTELTDEERRLQGEVRSFLESELPRGSFVPGLGFNAAKDPAFSVRLAEKGWVGMAPEALWRARSVRGRSLHRDGGASALGRAGRTPLGGRPPERSGDRSLRHRGAEAALPARDLSR